MAWQWFYCFIAVALANPILQKNMKNYDEKIVKELQKQIEKELKKRKEKREPIHLSLKEQNIIHAIDPVECITGTNDIIQWCKSLQGEWNGYGYNNLGKHLFVEHFVRTKNLLKKLNVEKKKETVILTDMEKIDKWENRLVNLTGISLEIAKKISDDKWNAWQDQMCNASPRWYKRVCRANPFRYIKNEEHAQAILSASNRHCNTDYEEQLEEAKEKVKMGEIDKSEVQQYARQHTTY